MNVLPTTYLRCRRKLAFLRGDTRAVARWSNLIETRRKVPILRKAFDVTVPPNVYLEITTDCNYRCRFCPQSSYQRPARYITRQSYRRVVDELKRIDFGGVLVLSVNNEPFLHPLLIEFCGEASEESAGTRTLLMSNGSLIREEHITAMASLARPPMILIDDYTSDHHIIQRVGNWLARLDVNNMRVDMRERSSDERLSNRAGNQSGCTSCVADYRDILCTHPFGGLCLTPELKAFLCCSDYRHEMTTGDLNTEHLMDIWSGPVLNRVREAMLAGDRASIDICARCDAEWWDLPAHCAGRQQRS